MADARVDKGWQDKGLDMYEAEAIFGTLNHYGVKVDQAAFDELAKNDYPLGIAAAWLDGWKGTGAFTRFPVAAAEELWRRACPGELAPSDVALAVVNLLKALGGSLEGKPDETLDTRFRVVEAYLPRIGGLGARKDDFIAELLVALAEWLDALDALGEALARKGCHAEADRFVAIEEALFEVRQGAAAALVKAAKGDEGGARVDLCALGDDASRDPFNRLAMADALLDLDATSDALRITLAVLDLAEAKKDLALAADASERLKHVIKADPLLPDRAALDARLEKLAVALLPGGA